MQPSSFLTLLALIHCGSAFFSTDFTRWLDENHSIGKRQWLERADIHRDGRGSFGGMEFDNDILTFNNSTGADNNGTLLEDLVELGHNPIVFVHGVADTAGEMMKAAAVYYKEHANYTFGEMYATTYDNPRGDKMRWMQYTMKCDHVKRVRFLIEAVHKYTGRSVDVVAFSMGVPIARKAILGGRCVDTNENLGGRLTTTMGVFVGVSGPNKGVAPVVMGIPYALCSITPIPVCNAVNGLFSGFCPWKSRFIDDINRRHHYEAQRIFTIGSTMDEVVGHRVCGEVTTRINAQNGEKLFYKYKHKQTFFESFDTQIAMLNDEPF